MSLYVTEAQVTYKINSLLYLVVGKQERPQYNRPAEGRLLTREVVVGIYMLQGVDQSYPEPRL